MGQPERDDIIRDATTYITLALRTLGILQDEVQGAVRDSELDLERTPARIVKMWLELTQGLRQEPPEVTVFESEHNQMLVLKDISFISLCSHHFAPFRGTAHIGYIPNGKIVGISKPARIVDFFAAQPQTQERLTDQVATFLMGKLEPQGVGVVMEAEHTCIACRGARKPGSRFITSVVKGLFLEKPDVKQEFLSFVGVSNG